MKPILFNTDMVRAIQNGTKAVTRRVVKPHSPKACGFYVTHRESDGAFMGVYDYDENEREFDSPQAQPAYPGDILYVRETWDKCPKIEEGSVLAGSKQYFFRADGDLRPKHWKGRWRPSIHMPREAARIFLRVTDVRVQQLKDVTEEDARAEGFGSRAEFIAAILKMYPDCTEESWMWVIEFERISREEAMNSDCTEESWMWAIEFERISREEAMSNGS